MQDAGHGLCNQWGTHNNRTRVPLPGGGPLAQRAKSPLLGLSPSVVEPPPDRVPQTSLHPLDPHVFQVPQVDGAVVQHVQRQRSRRREGGGAAASSGGEKAAKPPGPGSTIFEPIQRFGFRCC